MKDIIESLKKEIVQHDKVKNSILGAAPVWKNNHYEVLSNIVNDGLSSKITTESEHFFTLGNTISQITIKRFYEGQIKPTAYNDLRFLKTLDKIAIFLGYDNLNHFIEVTNGTQTNTEDENAFTLTKADFNEIKNIITDCCLYEYKCMQNLDSYELDKFKEFIDESGPYLKRIKLYLEKLKSTEIVMNREMSNIEIYNVRFVAFENDTLIFATDEFWNMIFEKNGNHIPFHKKGEQTYYIRKGKEGYRIWDNYNPDFNEIINPKKP